EDFVQPTVDIQSFSDEWLSCKGRVPQLRRENRERWRQAPGTVGFVLVEEASLCGLNAKRIEEMDIDRNRPHAQRSIACHEVDFAGCVSAPCGSVRSHHRKRLSELPELQVLLHRERVPGQSEHRKFSGQ